MSWSARFATSWRLFLLSWQVLRTSPRLLWLPAVSTGCVIVLALFFIVPAVAYGIHVHNAAGRWVDVSRQANAFFYAYGVLLYFIAMFVGTFFSVAFYHQIMRAFSGGSVSVRDGLRFAWTRVGAIALWSLLAASVGMVIRAVEERLGWLGKIVMGFIGVVWSVAAVFAIPVIIRRVDKNPLAVLRDSAATLKQTWGESLIGFVGLKISAMIFVLGSLVFLAAALAGLFWLNSGALFGVMVGLWLISLLLASFAIAVATDVYRCALYVYASEGVVPGPYTPDLMNAAWKVKKTSP